MTAPDRTACAVPSAGAKGLWSTQLPRRPVPAGGTDLHRPWGQPCGTMYGGAGSWTNQLRPGRPAHQCHHAHRGRQLHQQRPRATDQQDRCRYHHRVRLGPDGDAEPFGRRHHPDLVRRSPAGAVPKSDSTANGCSVVPQSRSSPMQPGPRSPGPRALAPDPRRQRGVPSPAAPAAVPDRRRLRWCRYTGQ